MADAPSSPMNQAKQVLKQLNELWGKQPKGRRTLAVLILVGVIGFVGITSFLHKTEQWSTVAEGMGPGNSQQLYTSLIGRGVNARMKDGKVEVLDEDLAQARAIATVSGATNSAKTFEDMFGGDTHMGRSSYDEQIAFKMALEGELSRSVMSLVQSESARVSIAFGKSSALKEMDSPPTASVTLMTRPGQQVTTEQVKGIRALVAASVDRLKPEAVVVIGPRGPLDGADEKTANQQQDLEVAVANKTRSVLEKIVGVGHVSVFATADVDTSKISQTEELFDKDSATVRSESRTLHGSDPSNGQSSVGGVAGTQGNLPGAPAPTGAAAGSGAKAAGTGDLQETKNYEISKKVVSTVKPDQTIKKLHIAIVVDEPKDKAGKPLPNGKDKIDQMLALARNTAGIDDARGDTIQLTSMPFAPVIEPEVPALPKPLLPVPLPVAAGGAGGVLVLLIVVVLLIKSKKNKKNANKTQALLLKGGKLPYPTPVHEFERQVIEAEDPNAVAQAALAKKEAPGLPAGKTAQERVMDVVRADVERAAGVLTGWLAEVPAAPKGATK